MGLGVSTFFIHLRRQETCSMFTYDCTVPCKVGWESDRSRIPLRNCSTEPCGGNCNGLSAKRTCLLERRPLVRFVHCRVSIFNRAYQCSRRRHDVAMKERRAEGTWINFVHSVTFIRAFNSIRFCPVFSVSFEWARISEHYENLFSEGGLQKLRITRSRGGN